MFTQKSGIEIIRSVAKKSNHFFHCEVASAEYYCVSGGGDRQHEWKASGECKWQQEVARVDLDLPGYGVSDGKKNGGGGSVACELCAGQREYKHD